MSHFVYIVKCLDNTLYTGYSTNVTERCAKHNAGKGAKYTRSRLPVVLVYWCEFETKTDAMRREWQIKQLSRSEKLQLINKFKHEKTKKSYRL